MTEPQAEAEGFPQGYLMAATGGKNLTGSQPPLWEAHVWCAAHTTHPGVWGIPSGYTTGPTEQCWCEDLS